MKQDPIKLFEEWYVYALDDSPLQHSQAVCVSTVDQHGIPEARFVALKDVSEKGFTFCSAFNSPKSIAIEHNPHAALTFWWDHIERQVRITGKVLRITDEEADQFFQVRKRDAQLTSWASQQSAILDNPKLLEQRLQELEKKFEGQAIPRPKDWGGYRVQPSRIEFLKFQSNRLHERLLFTNDGSEWTSRFLQP